ncbi:MAG TPA: hypothetical protein VN841_20905 [Bryobacteraceae bacterium]|nr:hypothetical protein [Bryobacteraceae bacterium]
MTRNPILAAMTVAILFALLPASAQPSAGSAPAASAATEIPRLPDGHPDLNGIWQIPYTPDMSRALAGKLPYTARGEAEFKNYDPAKFDYTGHCLPPGLTRAINTPDPIQISQTKDNVVILFEGFSSFITVHTDGRPHAKNIEPTWFGNSVGRWEGDTLVIDTIGFNDKTRLDTIGHVHSDQLHVVQRFTRKDATHIAFEITVEDPVMYTEPFTNKRTFTLQPKWDLMEYVCGENNKDFAEGHIK